MKLLHKSILLSVSLVICQFFSITAVIPPASAGTCPNSRWVPVPKIDYYVPAYPEENTTYWIFDFQTYKNMKLEIKGKFPYARYMNLILYDYNSGEVAVWEYNGIKKKQVLEDRDIIADEDNYNPYQPNLSRLGENRNYTVHVVREDNDSRNHLYADGTLKDNTLVIPSDLNIAAVFLRVYMPDNEGHLRGDVPLPVISTFYLNDNGLAFPSPCPNQQIAPPDRLTGGFLGLDPAEIDENDPELEHLYIWSYKPGGADKDGDGEADGDGFGLYPNGENPYLLAPLMHDPEKDVATMKFKAPTFSRTREFPNIPFSENDEVRYFSVCMGGYVMTNTSDCFSDEDLKIDADGYVHIAVVPNGEKSNYDSDPVWNVFKWGQHLYPALLYRQIGVNPDFENSFSKADVAIHVNMDPETSSIADIVSKKASVKIGEYAPEGIYCSLDEFKEDRCERYYPLPIEP